MQLAISEDSMLAGRATQDVEANDLYLKARYFENRGGREQTVRAVEYFRAAIAKDSNYAKAYAGLAEARLMGGVFNYFPLREALTEAAAAAHRAVRLDDRLAETHAALARVLAWQGDTVGAEREYLRAIELNPSYAYAHVFYGQFLTARGRFDQAIEEGKKGQRLDPTSAMANAALGSILLHARRFTDAIEFYRNAAELEPSSAVTLGRLGNLYGRTGSRGAALEILHRLLEMSRSQDVWQPLAQVYAGLGDTDRAFHALERARAGGYPFTAIETLPIWDPIRSDPRFREFLRRPNRAP